MGSCLFKPRNHTMNKQHPITHSLSDQKIFPQREHRSSGSLWQLQPVYRPVPASVCKQINTSYAAYSANKLIQAILAIR
jgi:hypothetical protein